MKPKTQKPTKEQIREWLRDEVNANRPPPTPERIREILGWKLVKKNKIKK